ncbi:MAG: oxidoreductase [Anaerolineaceae bacterium]|jgi:short-subunit dehydrogenase|nr:SDR family NAD(P)-dependent oxidoreductase [Anaerolineae bacterium]MBV6464905.1 NADP-dependent 3-hydroxy acid dehydrogenase YdfG [Anaerolineales bacterium]MCE7904350.1 SDR family oxidoreductase [Anaerolineae bacterium CFX3]MDL1925449.1 SDR family oxidoreductase [Anaerolineae bacterium AMX1]GER79376.1 short-chain dehydrogenase [Candidatus Denitrolinea symbiosum]GIK09948.1 MAG: oxidoreductase [Chloroflexota bacterium]GJQ38949.1 MAG: oxidoreductase [Anaerolineaceae bacterium]
MMDWKNQTAIVTGASSGIGEATARRLAAAGMRVVLVARRMERLLGLRAEIASAGGKAEALAADLGSEAERRRVFEQVGAADVLVNNAGFGWYGYFNEMRWETARDMLQVNVEAAAHLTTLFLPGMRERNRGHIVNVGSISGNIPSQGIALYGATKAFLDNFTTALARELRGTRVHASVVRAGPVRTEFGEAALSRENGGHVPTEKVGVTSEVVAREIWRLLQRPRRVVYVPRWMGIVPWVELSFGWIIDRVGPLLLRRQTHTKTQTT